MHLDVCHWCLRKVKPERETQKANAKVFCSMDCVQKEYLFQQWQECAIKLFFKEVGRDETKSKEVDKRATGKA